MDEGTKTSDYYLQTEVIQEDATSAQTSVSSPVEDVPKATEKVMTSRERFLERIRRIRVNSEDLRRARERGMMERLKMTGHYPYYPHQKRMTHLDRRPKEEGKVIVYILKWWRFQLLTSSIAGSKEEIYGVEPFSQLVQTAC
ncbi:uncharacterized protein [Periplaneta americana]|uniref:uncharacterized protein n=1 Tax=Periplaneta americana TaxID=6978 RepID=UPI0037E8A952